MGSSHSATHGRHYALVPEPSQQELRCILNTGHQWERQSASRTRRSEVLKSMLPPVPQFGAHSFLGVCSSASLGDGSPFFTQSSLDVRGHVVFRSSLCSHASFYTAHAHTTEDSGFVHPNPSPSPHHNPSVTHKSSSCSCPASSTTTHTRYLHYLASTNSA